MLALKILFRRYWLVLSILSICALYFTSWKFRREMGLIHPMANMAYYYYGSDPNTISDRALYLFYYPVYRTCGDRYGIHWSNRRDEYDPSKF